MFGEEDWDNPNCPVGVPSSSNEVHGQVNYDEDQTSNSYQRGRGGSRGRRGTRGGRRGFGQGDTGSWSGNWRSSTRYVEQGSDQETTRRNNYRSDKPASENRVWRNRNADNVDDDSRETDNRKPVVLSVLSSDVGKIIGRGGSKIKELQEKSGASIQVKKNQDEGLHTNVHLFGSDEATEKAKQLITSLTEDYYKGGSGGFKSNESQGKTQQNSSEYVVADEDGYCKIDWDKLNLNHEKAQIERWGKCPTLLKNFYVEDEQVANMSPEEVKEFRKANNNIVVSYVFEEGKEKIPNPVKSFEQCFSSFPEIMNEISKQGFDKPSPIQCQAWPVLLKGHDLIGIAQTGTGKTLAFLLPALIHIDRQPVPRHERGGPNVLVMAPTRELAIQIEKEVSKYSYREIKSVCVYGGGNRREQVTNVEKGVEIIIATPGRLNDLIQAEVINVTSITYLVLDEADRMLDLGFEPQIRKILLDIRPDRQTVMTSATWPEGVRRLAQSYMNNPIQVFIGTLNLAAVHSVTQKIEIIDVDNKDERLYGFLLGMEKDDKAIVFVGKKMKADHISSDLSLHGVRCQSIHGDREQVDREQALDDLKKGYVKILIATDVASRGIDIEDVTHIFNYDFPRNIEEYVHRVGRTGRAGRSGIAISLVTREDWGQARELIHILEEANQEIPAELYKMAERHEAWVQKKHEDKLLERSLGGGGGRGRRGGADGWDRGGGGSWSRGRRDRF